ncbi:hypothetical protein PAXRUDRAFT_149756, partial [Paxillus rubicundulus Ve08.2h10]
STTTYVLHLHTTMNAENHFKQLKHHHLHHLLCPCLDQLIWILCTKVTPGYIHHAGILEDTYCLGQSNCLSPLQMKFKCAWHTLADTPTGTLNHAYTVNISTWMFNCGSQKYSTFHLCKHLIQAISMPSPSFVGQVI